jgi:hypothetical protein
MHNEIRRSPDYCIEIGGHLNWLAAGIPLANPDLNIPFSPPPSQSNLTQLKIQKSVNEPACMHDFGYIVRSEGNFKQFIIIIIQFNTQNCREAEFLVGEDKRARTNNKHNG